MDLSPIIRIATEQDLPGILEIFNYNLIHTTAIYDYEPYSMEKITNWFAEKKEKNFPLFVAELNKMVVGYVTYGTFRTRPAYNYTVEHSIYVHKDYQKRGIARLLMERIISAARSDGKHCLIGGMY